MAIDRAINLKVQADTAKARADIKRLQVQLNNLSKVKLGGLATGKITTGMARLGQQTTRTTSQIEKMGGRINAAFNIAIVLGFTNAVAKAGDSILNLSNQLKSSGVEAKALNNNIAFTLRTANATRTSFKSAGVLLSRMTRSTATLGFGMKDVQKATTTVIKGFQLAGATTQEATQSVIQLSQGLASGALRGDELRSVLEGAPVLAASIAKELGVGVGQLRDMGKEGKITSEVVMRALLNDADALNAKFAEMKPTFEGAFEVFKNGLTVAVGESANILGDALGIKTAFMDAGKALTEAFLDGRVKVFVGEFVRDFREASARIKGFFANTFDNLGLDLPDLSDILAGLATLLGVKMLAGGRRGQTAFTPIRADVAGLDTQVKNLQQTMKGGFPVGKATGLGLLQQGLGQTKTSADALRTGLAQGFKLGAVKGLSGLNTGFTQAQTSAETFRTALTRGFSVGRITGLDAVYQNIGQVKTSATDLRSNIGKDFKAGALDVKPLTSGLTVVATQMANLRKSMGRGFKIGSSSSTEGGLSSTGGFLIAPARVAEQKAIVADFTKSIATASATVQGYANGVARFFGNVSNNIGAMAERADFKLGVLDGAIEENRKGLAKATTAYNTHAGAVNRLGLLYDGLKDSDFGTDKERSLSARLDAESVKLNQARADIDRYNGSLKANEAARGSFITGLEAQQKAFTKTQRVFARMAGVMNISLPTLRAGFDRLATTANNVGTAFTTMGTKAVLARGKINSAIAGVGKLQGSMSGQVAGTVGATVLLSEFFTFNEDTSQFENGIVEKMRSGISNAISKYTPLDSDQADLGAKMATIIAGAVGAFAVVSAVGGAIGALLLSPLVIGASVIAFTAFIATSESEMADNIRAFLLNSLKAVGKIGVKLSLDGIEAVINAPLNALTGSEGNIQERQSAAILRENEAGNFLESAYIADQTNTLFRGMTEQQVKDSADIWQKELDKLEAGTFLERTFNSTAISAFYGAIEQADARLARIGKAKFGQDTGVGLRSTYNDLLPPSSLEKRASGGFISGAGTATSDSIPAMLSNGEYVMKASSVSKFGAGFMAKINAGIMPQMFNTGGAVGANPEALQRLYDEQAKDQKAISGYKVSLPTSTNGFSNGLSDSDAGIYDALKTNIAERAADIAELVAQNNSAGADTGGANTNSLVPTTTPTVDTPELTIAQKTGVGAAESFKNTFASSFKEAFKTGDFTKIIPNLLDNFTGSIIDSVVDGFTKSLFEGITGEGGSLSNFFEGMFNFGGDVQTKVGKSITSGIEKGGSGEGLSGMFSGLTESLSGLLGGLGESLSGLFSGGADIFGSIFGGIGKIFGFSQGGIVPSTSTSQAGKDSVPAMLMPGEVVLSKNDVSRMGNNNSGGATQNFSINVQGNVDRQTRAQIVKMMPQIAAGVNVQNKERNYRG